VNARDNGLREQRDDGDRGEQYLDPDAAALRRRSGARHRAKAIYNWLDHI
jgi:hypothetical protein